MSIKETLHLSAMHHHDKQNVDYLLRKIKELSRMTTKIYIDAEKYVNSPKRKSKLSS